MCRSGSDGGRRCPCDSNTARVARRRNRKAINDGLSSGVSVSSSDEKHLSDLAGESSLIPQEKLSRWGTVSEDEMMNRVELRESRKQEVSEARMSAISDIVYETSRIRQHDSLMNVDEATELLPSVQLAGALIAVEAESRVGFNVENRAAQLKDMRTQLFDESAEIEQINAKWRSEYAEIQKGMKEKRDKFKDVEREMRLSRDEASRQKLSEELAEVKSSYNEFGMKSNARIEEYNAFIVQRNQNYNNLYYAYSDLQTSSAEAMSKAYQEVLSETRAIGTATGKVKKHKLSQSKIVAFVNDAATYFPQEWWNRSDAEGEVIYKATTKRAHYSHGAFTVKKVRQPRFYFAHDDCDRSVSQASFDNFDEDGYPIAQLHLKKGSPQHDFYLKNAKIAAEKSLFESEKESIYRIIEKAEAGDVWITNFNSDQRLGYDHTPPTGKGWVRLGENQRGMVGWVKVNTEMQVDETHSTPELLVHIPGTGEKDRRKSPEDTARYSKQVALHELTHRFEHTSRNIGRMEKAFYEKRTTKNGEREPLTVYKKGVKGTADEVVRGDDFLDIYMGRSYEHRGEEYPAWEIMSMGTESVFGGSNGGLSGLHGGKSDHDMRSFILGMFATA